MHRKWRVEVAATLDRSQVLALANALHYAMQRLPVPPRPTGSAPDPF